MWFLDRRVRHDWWQAAGIANFDPSGRRQLDAYFEGARSGVENCIGREFGDEQDNVVAQPLRHQIGDERARGTNGFGDWLKGRDKAVAVV